MSKIEIGQDELNEYLCSTDEFWTTFHKGLKAPFNVWNDLKDSTREDWAQTCKMDKDVAGYLNIIFSNTPILKGEFPTVYADNTGLILTNYRLFYNSSDDGLIIIPLKDLVFYGEKKDKVIIKYDFEGKTKKIKLYRWILPEWVEKTKNAREYEDLDEAANSLLKLTFYDYEKNNLKVEKIDYLPDPIVEEKPETEKSSNDIKQNGLDGKSLLDFWNTPGGKLIAGVLKDVKEGFKPDQGSTGYGAYHSRFTNLWNYSIRGKGAIIGMIIIIYYLAFGNLGSILSGKCQLAGCDRDGNGWKYYSTSQGTTFGYEQIGCLRKYSSGGYCSKSHCAQDL